MYFYNLISLITYLLYLFKPLLAIPLIDASPEAAAKPSSRVILDTTTHIPPPISPPSHLSRRTNYHHMQTAFATIHSGSIAYGLVFSGFTQTLPIKAAALALDAIYFDIHFNLSPHGQWYHRPPQSRVLLRAGDMYLLFTATDPFKTVPWALIKQWVVIMERFSDLGGFVGFYIASFRRLVDEDIIDYMVETGIGNPVLLAAPAA
ncbi:MAG: hypothetical protein Q9168_004899 [Polycauliona sp. 1 TL-2023]